MSLLSTFSKHFCALHSEIVEAVDWILSHPFSSSLVCSKKDLQQCFAGKNDAVPTYSATDGLEQRRGKG
jgi:hypothetical protein